VLDFVEDPDDPNEPGHEECLITSRDLSQLLLFITVPDGKQLRTGCTLTCARWAAAGTGATGWLARARLDWPATD